MIRSGIIVFLIVLTYCPFLAVCQNFPLQHFTTENGLPSNTIYGLYRDSKGFLWMGTDKGVVRYNGIDFEKFTTEDGLPDNDVFFFQEDLEGRLWLGTYNGELCFYKDGIFHTAANTPFLKKTAKYSFIDVINVEKDSSVTITFRDRLAFLNIYHEQCHSYFLNSVPQTPYSYILYIGKISADRYRLLYENSSLEIDTMDNYISGTLQDNVDIFKSAISQGYKYLYSAKGIYSLDGKLQMAFKNELASSFIYTTYTDKRDWYTGTSDGLFINNGLHILRGCKINCITQDAEGNFWISDLDNGVFCLGKGYADVKEYDNAYTGKIRYACIVGESLFFTTGNSNFYRFENGRPKLLLDYFQRFGKYYKGENSREKYLNAPVFGQGVDNNYRYFNIENNFSFIIDKINTNSPVVSIFKKSIPAPFGYIKELIFGNEQIFLRSTDFISAIDKPGIKPGTPIMVKKINNNKKGWRIFGTALSPDNSLWYSGFDGVNKIIDTTTIPQEQFGNITFKWMQIAGNYAVGITHKNQLLVCNNFEYRNISIDTIADGNIVWDKLYKLNDSTFLVSTDNLYRLLSLRSAKGKPDFTLQTIENNLLPAQAEYICNNDSFCYFFKKGSITRVPNNCLVVKHAPPTIYFRSLKTRFKSYPITPGIVVDYNESKNISISFSPFSFGSKYLICEYSISNDTTEYWRQVKNNEINLFDPSFGNYTVKVRAKTLSGDFSQPFVFSFTISKPFWATYWFISVSILLLIGIVILVLRIITLRNTQKRERTHQNEIKFLKSEYKALNALMNPHFIFNTLNNVQWLVNNDDKLTANHYLRVFSDLVRQNMNNISKELISLSNEIELVNNYLKLEKLRFKEAFNYSINIDEDVDMDNVKIPPLLIQPLVENAIKHGLLPGTTSNNLLKMNIYKKQDKLFVDIIDNGVGFNESQKKTRSLHKSTGIENIRKRIEKLSLMHDINISFMISEQQNSLGVSTGTLARICIELNEE